MERPTFDQFGPAECRSVYDPEIFFTDPKDTSRAAQRNILAAKAVCARCPYKLECAAWAIQEPNEEGIWGGLTEPERKKTRRKGLLISPSRRVA